MLRGGRCRAGGGGHARSSPVTACVAGLVGAVKGRAGAASSEAPFPRCYRGRSPGPARCGLSLPPAQPETSLSAAENVFVFFPDARSVAFPAVQDQGFPSPPPGARWPRWSVLMHSFLQPGPLTEKGFTLHCKAVCQSKTKDNTRRR